MVSMAPNSIPFDMSHMYDFQDLRGPTPVMKVDPNSILGYIRNSHNFKLYDKIITLARLEGRYNDSQSNSTVFIVPDNILKTKYKKSYFDNMDNGLAKQIMQYSTLNRKIDEFLLTSSPISQFETRNSSFRLCIRNINNISTIDNKIQIIHFNQEVNNGIIHMVNDILVPPNYV